MYFQVQTFATGRSLVQRGPTECAVSEGDHLECTMKRPRAIGLSSHELQHFRYLLHIYENKHLYFAISARKLFQKTSMSIFFAVVFVKS